jgi:hypothetical protein
MKMSPSQNENVNGNETFKIKERNQEFVKNHPLSFSFSLSFCQVPGTGVEPVRSLRITGF